jgi:hypothetical protein
MFHGLQRPDHGYGIPSFPAMPAIHVAAQHRGGAAIIRIHHTGVKVIAPEASTSRVSLPSDASMLR